MSFLFQQVGSSGTHPGTVQVYLMLPISGSNTSFRCTMASLRFLVVLNTGPYNAAIALPIPVTS